MKQFGILKSPYHDIFNIYLIILSSLRDILLNDLTEQRVTTDDDDLVTRHDAASKY